MAIEIDVSGIGDVAVGRRASTAELNALDDQGFVVVPALLQAEEVNLLRAEFERLVAEDLRSNTKERGARRAKGGNDNKVLAVCWRHRVVLHCAAHVLGATFQVSLVDLRDPNPGCGEQRLHPDHGPTAVPGITATWFFDAFTEANGATRLLPGSHRSPPASSEVPIPGTENPVAGEVVALGPPGSLLVRDARLFHAGGRNTTTETRRSGFVFYQHELPDPD